MSEDPTQGTRYFNALKDVADAARKLEEARVALEDGTDRLYAAKRTAEKEFREALKRAAEITGAPPPPVSKQEREHEEMKRSYKSLENKKEKS